MATNGLSVSGREWAAKLEGGGVATVTTHAVRVRLTTTLTPVGGVILQAPAGNTGDVTVGGSDVVAATGATHVGTVIPKGESLYLPIRDLSLLWFDALNDGDTVYYNPIS